MRGIPARPPTDDSDVAVGKAGEMDGGDKLVPATASDVLYDIGEGAATIMNDNPHLDSRDADTVGRLAALRYLSDNLLRCLAAEAPSPPPLIQGNKVSPLLDDVVRLYTLTLRYEEVLA